MPETAGAVGAAAPGGTESARTGPRDRAFRQLGAIDLAEDLALFAVRRRDDSERSSFMEKARRDTVSGFLRGHAVCSSTVSAMDVVVLILSKWGEKGEPHPDGSSVPLGLRGLVLS